MKREAGLGTLIAGNPWLSDAYLFDILNGIKENSDLGTIELADKVGIAPKNIIVKLKKLQKEGIITVENIKVKPKGRRRKFSLTKTGDKLLKDGIQFKTSIARLIASSPYDEHGNYKK